MFQQIIKRNKFYQYFKLLVFQLGLCVSITQLVTPKVLAAERIIVQYGALEFPLSVETLKIYAQEGKITGELANYAELLSPQQLKDLQTGLAIKADIKPLSIAQFFYSYQGEKILERVGKIVTTQAGQSGFYAIRSALILAAASEEGLTPLNFLKTFPTSTIKIDSAQGFKIIDQLSNVIQTTNKTIAAVDRESLIQTAQENSIFLEGINGKGNFSYIKKTLSLKDYKRKRSFLADLYLPQKIVAEQPLSLIVISHGLGGDRETFAYFAQYLASYGFAVAVPEHPGSNAKQINNLLEGFANDVTPPQEFLNRPLDITFLLNEIEARYKSQINTKNVGIIGQSFGGYTALALAGAALNFKSLNNACSNLDKSFNVSLFLQCLALELPPEITPTNLKDNRITSAIAINPLTSAIFGQAGISKIDIPIMLVSGSADPVTPALPEQIKPFTWLNVAEKYLVLMKGGTHFSTLNENESSGSIPVPAAAVGPDPKIGQEYIKQLGLLFFSAPRTLSESKNSQSLSSSYSFQSPNFGCLCAGYAASIARPPMPLSLIKELNLEELNLPSNILSGQKEER
jgi:predicted dienelactone hydrolase